MKFPEDDPLAEFLRHHRAPTPPAAAGLEDQIMATIDLSDASNVIPLRRSRRYPWLFSVGAVAAGLVAGLISYRTLSPAPVSQAELSRLASFMENNWQNTIGDTSDEEFISTAN